ncbi:sodium-dependent glucose transporter 1A-like [Glandiceps talaboti]
MEPSVHGSVNYEDQHVGSTENLLTGDSGSNTSDGEKVEGGSIRNEDNLPYTFRKRLLISLCLYFTFFGMGSSASITGPSLPDLQQQVGASLQQISLIATFKWAGYIVGALISGICLDKLNNFIILCLAALVSCITALNAWTKHLTGLLAIRGITGIASGFLDTGSNIVCLRLWQNQVGPYIQTLHFSFAIGSTVGPLIAAPFLTPVNYSATTTTTVAPTEMVNYAYNVTRESNWQLEQISLLEEREIVNMSNHRDIEYLDHSVYLASIKKLEDRVHGTQNSNSEQEFQVLGDMQMQGNKTGSSPRTLWIPYAISGIIYFVASIFLFIVYISGSRICLLEHDNTFPGIQSNKDTANNSVQQETPLFRYLFVGIMAVFYFLVVSHETVYGFYLYTYLTTSDLSFTIHTASYLNSAFWGSYAASRGLSVLIATRLSPRNMLIMNLTGLTIATSILAVWGWQEELLLWTGTVLLGACIAPCFPTGFSWTERQLILTGKTTSIFLVSAGAAGIVEPFILGAIFDKYSIMDLMYVMFSFSCGLVIVFVIAVLVTIFHRQTDHIDLSQRT